MIESKSSENVGIPFKDTNGPSMNILIKLSTILALIIAPHISKKSKIKDVDKTEVSILREKTRE